MKAVYRTFLLILLTSSSGFAQALSPHSSTPWILSEKGLVEAIYQQSPQMLQLKKDLQDSKYDLFNLKENYQWQWVSEAGHHDSNEKAIASFIPTFGPTYFLATGLEKNFSSGIEMKTQVFTDQQSTSDNNIDKATRTGVSLELSIDLWKNLFGRADKANLADRQLTLEKQQLLNEVNKRAVELELRKVYWSLVANQEQQNITSGLLKISREQWQDGIRRGKQHIADSGEVARLHAQVESRKATLEALEAQRELYLQALKEQLPELATQQITLGGYDIEGKVQEVVRCTAEMIQRKDVPWNYTKADELIALIEKNFEEKKKVTDRYSSTDIQLTSAVQVSGVDRGYSNSFDDFTGNGETGYTVGLKVTVPLGKTQDRAKEAKEQSDLMSFQVEKQTLLAKTKAQHSQIVAMVMMLNSSLKSMETNSKALRESVKSSEQKFRQARISLNDLTADQDALLNSLLREIDTKLQVVHILLDYFKVFTEDPCSLNKVGV